METPIYEAFNALMRDLKGTGALRPTLRQRQRREETVRRHIAGVRDVPALASWIQFLGIAIDEVGAGGDVALLQQAIALADEHPVTVAAEAWLRAERAFSKVYLRLLNRPAGKGPPRPRAEWKTHVRDAVAASSDGRTVATAEGAYVAVYDVEAAALRTTFKTRHPENFKRMVLHPDGRRLLTGLAYDDSHVRMYDLTTGKELRKFRGQGDTQNFELAPDGRHVLGADDMLRLWDIDSKDKQSVWSTTVRGRYFNENLGRKGDWYNRIESNFRPLIDPTGTWCVVLAGDRLEFRALLDGAALRKVRLEVLEAALRAASVAESAIFPDGTRGLWVTDDQNSVIQVIDLETGTQLAKLQRHPEAITSLAVAPNGKRFAAASKDGLVSVWDAGTLRCLWLVRAHHGEASGVAFVGDDAIVTIGTDGAARLWDVEEATEISSSDRDPSDNVLTARITPNGQSLLALHEDGYLRRWDISQGACTHRIDASNIPRDGRLRLVIAPDGRAAFLVRDRWSDTFQDISPPLNATVYRFDIEAGAWRVFYSHGEPTLNAFIPLSDELFYVTANWKILKVTISPTGKMARKTVVQQGMFGGELVGDRWFVSFESNSLELFDAKDPSAGVKKLSHLDCMFTSLRTRIEPARVLVAVASSDLLVRVFRLPTGKLVRKVGIAAPEELDPAPVSFSADGRHIYTADVHGGLHEWNLHRRESRSWLLPDYPVQALAAHASLDSLVAAETKACIMLLDPKRGKLVARMGYPAASELDDAASLGIDGRTISLFIDRRILFLRMYRGTNPA